MARASIVFSVKKDYFQYLRFNDEGEYNESYGYKGAIKALNEDIQELIDSNQLTILYKHRRMPIRGNIQIHECGQIYGPCDEGGERWDDVEVWCTLPCSRKEFDFEYLRVGLHPDWMVPINKYVRS